MDSVVLMGLLIAWGAVAAIFIAVWGFRALWELSKVAAVIFLSACVFVMMGCATTDPEQAEWDRAMDYENWRTCMAVYEQLGAYSVHYDHSHNGKHKRSVPRWEDVKRDLLDNNCRTILRQAGLWAE